MILELSDVLAGIGYRGEKLDGFICYQRVPGTISAYTLLHLLN